MDTPEGFLPLFSKMKKTCAEFQEIDCFVNRLSGRIVLKEQKDLKGQVVIGLSRHSFLHSYGLEFLTLSNLNLRLTYYVEYDYPCVENTRNKRSFFQTPLNRSVASLINNSNPAGQNRFFCKVMFHVRWFVRIYIVCYFYFWMIVLFATIAIHHENIPI